MKRIFNSKFFILDSHQSKGFTLIELLVVISIIGILSGLILTNFMGARQRARDAQRKANLREIQNALELYKGNQTPPSYPATSGWRTALSSGTTVYMKTVPNDPNCPGGTCSGGWVDYSYARDTSDVLKYTLIACLENASDPQRDQPKASYCSTKPASYTKTEP